MLETPKALSTHLNTALSRTIAFSIKNNNKNNKLLVIN